MGSGGRWLCARVAGEALAVGCGDDELVEALEREGHRVVEVDAERAGALPFDAASFDTVLLGGFLAEWASRERPIAEARRVLRPRGRLLVQVPYGAGEGDSGVSLAALLADLGDFSVGEIATIDGGLCLLAERAREKSRAAVWRRALGVAEGQLAEREEKLATLAGSVADLEASREREERALADVRGDVERLESALAAATHQRDLEQEKARLAGEGVSVLEQRLERLKREGERERGEMERAQAEIERVNTEEERAHERDRAEMERRIGEAERKREADLTEAERKREADLADAEREHEGRIAEAKQQIAEAWARLATREDELAHSRKAVEAAQQELTEVRQSLSERERELAALAAELAARDADLAARLRELEAAGDRVESQAAQLARVQEEIREAELGREEARTGREEARTGLDEALARLETRERHLKTAQLGIESRDRKLAAADARLAAGDAQVATARREAEQAERRLALVEARLEKARQRAEGYRGSLVALREGRAYRLMRVLWRLRRPFRRAPRDAAPESGAAEDDSDSPAPVAPAPQVGVPLPVLPEREPGGRLRVASILDEMSTACFAPECDLVPLGLEGWAEQLDEHRPDLLLVESAWNGNGGEWQYRIARYPRKDLVGLPALRALLDGCRERGIPTAFWNKEDPVHFDRFAEAASLFDHVFTTDARCVERYRALPGERTVAPLPFAAQPRLHNPAAAVPERSASPCFAGAFYRDRHPDRRRALETLLDAARPYGLVIYDRRFGGDDDAFGFPERFAPHVLGRLPYERILDVYKSHRVFLNANSVVDSPTMCSRRVFELAACDTAILSTPGTALAVLLGEGVVDEPGDEESAAAALERLLADEPERRRRTRAARRAVFAEHTYAERLATIATAAGLDASSLRGRPFATPGETTNGAGDHHPWLLLLQPGTSLSESALADLAAAATFAEAEVIGTHPAVNGDPAIEHRHAPDLDPRVLLLRRELVEDRGRPSGSADEALARLRQWNEEGVRLYAADADLLATSAARPPAFAER